MLSPELFVEPESLITLTAGIAIGGARSLVYARRARRAEAASKKDAKTGLMVYPAFEEEVIKRTRSTKRAVDKGRTHAMILLDIDDFKDWNKRITHALNDREALLPVSSIMRSAVRPDGDLVSRFGGEEFFVFLSDTDAEGALTVCERVQGQINSIHPEENSPGRLGATMAYTTFQQGDYPESLENLGKLLSEGLNQAKGVPGKNQIAAIADSDILEPQLSLLSEVPQ